MKRVLVLGATGAMGYAIVHELVGRGIEVRAFARDRGKLDRLFGNLTNVQIVAGDALNMKELMQAAIDCDVIFHSINVPYHEWRKYLLKVMENVLDVAKEHSAKLAMVDNIYAYGRSNNGKVTENAPKNPHTRKGKLRLEQLNLIKNSGVPYVIAHFPDFYGPNAEGTMLGTTLANVIQNKKAMFVGDQKVPREHIYTPDGAKAIVTLAMTEKAYGQEWNIPAYDTITGEEIIELFREITGFNKKVMTVRKSMIQFIGLFNPFMREVVEMYYLTQEPVVLDGSKYEKEIGPLPRTPYKEGLQQTIEWMKQNKASKG
ncbi:NAD(P)H-binding protein [Calidifontibacillus erzurumensis]|uniref:NAD(P)H-binding protein n=1 Tax=Calidifontibacillus erzurumensis TaxID=2741433 RepID=UPI0035B53C65